MPRSHRTTRLILLLIILLSSPLAAYQIFLKDGSSISAKEKYRVQGDRAIIVLNSGTETSIPLVEIDVARTEEANKHNLGSSATLIDDSVEIVPRTDTPGTREALGDLVRRQQGANAARTAVSAKIPRTEAGFVDLIALTKKRHADEDHVRRLSAALQENGLTAYEIWAGSAPERTLVELVAESRSGVLDSLTATAKVFASLQAEGAAPQVLELLIRTATGGRAAMISFDGENAQLLAKGRIEVGDFFIEYVHF
jgi:hypothetical protein